MNEPYLPREISLQPDAALALGEILGIMTDQLAEGSMHDRWNDEAVVTLVMKMHRAHDGETIEMGLDEAALILDGMAFTEVMSVEFPFFDMVQWTSDFVTEQLRSHWSEDEWRSFASR